MKKIILRVIAHKMIDAAEALPMRHPRRVLLIRVYAWIRRRHFPFTPGVVFREEIEGK